MINICLSFDNKFAIPAKVLISSILLNSNCDDRFSFFILDDGLKKDIKVDIERLKSFKQFNIRFINVDKSVFKNYYLPEKGHFALVNYYRIKIPSLIPEVNKILYIDCDTIVKKSLRPLYEIDISNFYLAAAKSVTSYKNNRRLGLSKLGPYYNSGVILINSCKWKENTIESKLIEYIETSPIEKLRNLEQDAINSVLRNGIYRLPSNWNVEIRTDINYPNYYKKYLENPYILHYVSNDKPWHSNTKQDTKEFNYYLGKIKQLNHNNSKETFSQKRDLHPYQS